MEPQRQPAQKQDHQPGSEKLMHPAHEYEPRHPGCGKLNGKAVLISGGDRSCFTPNGGTIVA
jgi:hypothetical protein